MKVKELIAELQKHDQEKDIYLDYSWDYGYLIELTADRISIMEDDRIEYVNGCLDKYRRTGKELNNPLIIM